MNRLWRSACLCLGSRRSSAPRDPHSFRDPETGTHGQTGVRAPKRPLSLRQTWTGSCTDARMRVSLSPKEPVSCAEPALLDSQISCTFGKIQHLTKDVETSIRRLDVFMTQKPHLRPGQVRDAITSFLRERDGEAAVAEIHAAVEKKLGTRVSASSVRSYLNLNTPALFERPTRGRYRLAVP